MSNEVVTRIVIPGPVQYITPPKDTSTAMQRVMEAARFLVKRNRLLKNGKSFTFTDLVILAWQTSPVVFGLDDNLEYPDARKVNVCLCGKRGLVAKGMLKKLSTGLLALGEKA